MTFQVVLSLPSEQCLTFAWRERPADYIGYRCLEGAPLVLDTGVDYSGQPAADWPAMPAREVQAPALARDDNWPANWLTEYAEADPAAPVQLSFRAGAAGAAWCTCVTGAQQQEFHFQPVADGIEIRLRFSSDMPIEGGYCLQQCLRFTGRMNMAWRRAIAQTPYFSELDLQGGGGANLTLTHARRENEWFGFPVQHVAYPTRAGAPSVPEMSPEAIDHGLIVRESFARNDAPENYWAETAPGLTWDRIVAGLYWERTAYVSNRHPADCVHAVIDVGPLAAGQARTLHGKMYFFEGTKDDLLARWRKDFPGAG
jgi:hypothetical protein